MQDFAIALYDQGIITQPYSTTQKRPVIDKDLGWMATPPTREAFVEQWAKNGPKSNGIAVMTGVIGCLEADTKNDPDGNIHKRLMTMVFDHFGEGFVFSNFFLERSQSGGLHLLCRIPKDCVMGSQNLARIEYTDAELFTLGKPDNVPGRPNQIGVIVEWRGKGGLCTFSPSPGYDWVPGSVSSLDKLPEISVEDFDALLLIGRSFNRYEKPATIINYPAHVPSGTGKRPGDLYNAATGPEGMVSLLQQAGYHRIKQFGNSVYLSRPGARHPNKHDVKVNVDLNCFVNYSGSVTEFTQYEGYGPFALYTMLCCHGDFKEATKKVAAMGFDDPERKAAYQQKALLGGGAVPTAHNPDPFAVVDLETEEEELARWLAEMEPFRFSLAKRPNVQYTLFFTDHETGRLQPFAAPGNIVAVFGYAKARKTTVLGLIIAAIFSGRQVQNVVYSGPPGKVMWVETEQGDYYFWETMWRLHVQAQLPEDHKDRLFSYSTLGMSPQQRLEKIDKGVRLIKPDVLVLDGIIQFMTDMNDNQQAQMVLGYLQRWASMGIIIFPVLHLNPESNRPRGHIGTFLTNGCDNSIKVMLDFDDDDVSVVANFYSRGRSFKAFKLRAGEDGILYQGDVPPQYDYTIAKPERVQEIPHEVMSDQEVLPEAAAEMVVLQSSNRQEPAGDDLLF